MKNRLLALVEEAGFRKDIPDFTIGDQVDVHQRILEGQKERVQIFTGTVIARRGDGLRETFTVRRIVQGEGVERVFPIHSPKIARIEVKKTGRVRRAKLYYLRGRVGKATRLRERKAKAAGDGQVPGSASGRRTATKGAAGQLALIRRGAAQVEKEEELAERLHTGRPLRVKYGIDPTGADVHLGHTVPLRKLRLFQELGHQAVLIIGNYTALVGDPSGRDQTRARLTEEQVQKNALDYLKQISKIIDIA